MNAVDAEKAPESAGANPAGSPLNSVEVEIIHLFVQFASAIGQPRSIAEIYGLLFVTEKPLAMDTVIERLNLSKGSASQGLKYLQDLGAVRTVYVGSDRRTYYEVVAELRKLTGRFLRQQILARFEDGPSRLDRMVGEAQKLSGQQRKHLIERIKLLRRWERAGRRILPLALKVLGSD